MGGKGISEAIPEEVTPEFSLKDKEGLINEGMKKDAPWRTTYDNEQQRPSTRYSIIFRGYYSHMEESIGDIHGRLSEGGST